MSSLNEYALAQYRISQHAEPHLPEPGVNDWRTIAELRDAYRETRRRDYGRRPGRVLLRRALQALRARVPRPARRRAQAPALTPAPARQAPCNG